MELFSDLFKRKRAIQNKITIYTTPARGITKQNAELPRLFNRGLQIVGNKRNFGSGKNVQWSDGQRKDSKKRRERQWGPVKTGHMGAIRIIKRGTNRLGEDKDGDNEQSSIWQRQGQKHRKHSGWWHNSANRIIRKDQFWQNIASRNCNKVSDTLLSIYTRVQNILRN